MSVVVVLVGVLLAGLYLGAGMWCMVFSRSKRARNTGVGGAELLFVWPLYLLVFACTRDFGVKRVIDRWAEALNRWADKRAQRRRKGSNTAIVKSAESRRMARLANIPTVERRQAAVNRLLRRAK